MIVVSPKQTLSFPPKSFQIHLANFWKVYLDFQYFLLCCPFRLIIAKDGRSANTKQCPIQKILCLSYTFFGILWNFRNMQLSLSLPSNPKNPSLYLLMAVDINTRVLKLITAKRLVCDEGKLLQVVNYILDKGSGLPFPEISGNSFSTFHTMVVAVMICSFFTGMGFVHWFTGKLHYLASVKINSFLSWNITVWWDAMLLQGRMMFNLDDQVSNTWLEALAGVVAAIGYLWRLMLGSNENLFYIVLTFTLWVTTYEFQARLQNKNGNHFTRRAWSEIFREYNAIKNLADMISNLFGWTMLFMVVQVTLYYSVNFGDIFLQKCNFDGMKYFGYTLSSATIIMTFFLAADAIKKVCN